MAERKAFLLRLDPAVHAALERWAADELRSLNGQIEFVLREAMVKAGRTGSGAAGQEERNGGFPFGSPPFLRPAPLPRCPAYFTASATILACSPACAEG